MKNQVLSIEQMQHLKELGVDISKASAHYYNNGLGNKIYFNNFGVLDDNEIPTFTLQDMLEIIPYEIRDYFSDNSIFPQSATLKIIPVSDGKCIIKYVEQKHYWGIYESENSSDLLTCAYETLCWLAENGYLKGGKK